MKKRLTYLLFVTVFSFALVSCGDDEKKDDAADNTTEDVVEDETSTVQVADFAAGEAIYVGKGQCTSCHMIDGQGVEGIYPPLADSDFLKNLNKTDLIKTVIFGNNEPITVNGKDYPGNLMGPTMELAALTNQEIVDVVNFISDKWGNKETVTLEDVKAAKE